MLARYNIAGKSFNAPIVFIDEFDDSFSKEIKLLRNLSRMLPLSSVLASTNAKINNLLNVNSSSAPKLDAIWVNAIKKLPKANLNAILHVLNLVNFISVNNDNDIIKLDVKGLLNSYNIIVPDEINLQKLENLIKLMIVQSKTCLQGVSVFIFTALKDVLSTVTGPFDIRNCFSQIVSLLRSKLISRKRGAFSKLGPFHSLSMISNYRTLIAGKSPARDLPEFTSEIVLNTINDHYYYFGTDEDPAIMKFGCVKCPFSKSELTFHGVPYIPRSNFHIFRDDVFLCMGLWKNIDARDGILTVASVVSSYIHQADNATKNPNALSNNYSAQECVMFWGICNTSHREVSNMTSGPVALVRFIENVQVNNDTFKSLGLNTSIIFNPFHVPLNLLLCPNLVPFLSKIKVPYLIPDATITSEIRDQLAGICEIGDCSRLSNNEGIDIKFEIRFGEDEQKRDAFIECKYKDENLSKIEVLKYIIRAKDRNSPFSMLVTYSLQESLKSAAGWMADPEPFELEKDAELPAEPAAPKKVRITKKKIDFEEQKRILKNLEIKEKRIEFEKQQKAKIHGVSIYSVFYDDKNVMKMVPLVEFDNPSGVFIIVQTNFLVPKK